MALCGSRSAGASVTEATALHWPDAVVAIAGVRAGEAIWTDGLRLTPQAAALIDAIATAGADGLDPSDYHLPELSGMLVYVRPYAGAAWVDQAASRRAETLLTDAFLALGLDLAQGRIDPSAVWEKWEQPVRNADLRSQLQAILCGQPAVDAGTDGGTAAAVTAALAACRRTDPGYLALKRSRARLATITADGGWPAPGSGPVLRPDGYDPRVPTLRTRLRLSGDLADLPPRGAPWLLPGSGAYYDASLVAAVRRFQRRHGLRPDGLVGPRTVAALDVTAARRLAQVTLNLERWRWLPADDGTRRIEVNIPDYSLALVESGRTLLSMRAVVGRPDRPTPVLTGSLRWLVLNPRWNVPQKLAREDLLPKVLSDADYLTSRGFRVYTDWRPGAAEVDPARIDWAAVKPYDMAYKFSQAAGPHNPLGRAKFLFPNPFSVYIHDTNQPAAFAADRRCFSSGCVRIEAPDALLAHLAAGGLAPTDSTALAAGETVAVGLAAAVPVRLVYLTAWVAEDGLLQFREDCYGYDEELAAALAVPRRIRPLPQPLLAAAAAAAPLAGTTDDGSGDYQVRTGPVSMWTNPGPE